MLASSVFSKYSFLTDFPSFPPTAHSVEGMVGNIQPNQSPSRDLLHRSSGII